MPQSKRAIAATAALTTTPPNKLPMNHAMAQVVRLAGNNLYAVVFAQNIQPSPSPNMIPASETSGKCSPKEGLVELPSRFRNAIWLKRGSYVVVDTQALGGRENKLAGEIVNVVREERSWRRMSWWPVEFGKNGVVGNGLQEERYDDSDNEGEEQSRVGLMPPSDDEDEDE